MTSASKDGELIARIMKYFGAGAVRGSSSRRGAQAFKEALEEISQGKDIVITPDGPRGPIYQLHPGVTKLAAQSACSILPIHVQYHKSFRFKSWDRFHLPLPFSRVKVTFEELIEPTEKADVAKISNQLQSSLLTHEQ